MQLRSSVAVAVVEASNYSSDLYPSLGTSICCGCSPKKTKIITEKWEFPLWVSGLRARLASMSSDVLQ